MPLPNWVDDKYACIGQICALDDKSIGKDKQTGGTLENCHNI